VSTPIADVIRVGGRAVGNAARGIGRRHPGFGGSKPKPKYQGASGPLSGTDSHREREKADSIRAMQAFLISKGYAVTESGKMDARTKSAVADWHKGVGQRNPKRWSARNPLPVRPDDRPGPRGPGALAPKPPAKPTAPKPTNGGGTTTPKPKPSTTTPGPRSGAAGATALTNGVERYDSELASRLAGLQFDPQIRMAELERERVTAQGPQNLADIKNWYDEVLASQATAKQRDAAIIASGVGSVGDAAAKVVSSLGGGANPGAGVVGAAGAEAAGTLAALGAAGNEYNEDIRPLLQAEGAGVSAREMAMQSQRAREVAAQIMNLRGQRGAAEASAGLDIQRMNNELAQQDFQNNLAVEQTIQAANMAGLQLEEAKLRNTLLGQQVQQGSQPQPQPGDFVPWAKLPLPDRMSIVNSAISQVVGPQGGLIMSPAKTFQLARQRAVTLGYNNPQMLSMIRQAVREAHARSKAKGEWVKAKGI
jgi:hypothetical protein